MYVEKASEELFEKLRFRVPKICAVFLRVSASIVRRIRGLLFFGAGFRSQLFDFPTDDESLNPNQLQLPLETERPRALASYVLLCLPACRRASKSLPSPPSSAVAAAATAAPAVTPPSRRHTSSRDSKLAELHACKSKRRERSNGHAFRE